MGPGGHYYFETLNKNLLEERPPYHFSLISDSILPATSRILLSSGSPGDFAGIEARRSRFPARPGYDNRLAPQPRVRPEVISR